MKKKKKEKVERFADALGAISDEARSLKNDNVEYNIAVRLMCRKYRFYTDYKEVWKNPDECLIWILFATGIVYGVIDESNRPNKK